MGQEDPGAIPAWMLPPMSRWSDPPGPPDRALRSRRVLLVAAARRFDRFGYHGASIRDILIDTELTKGALYFHFGSKQQLAVALLREVSTAWDALVAEIGTRDLDPLWRLLVETDAYVARWMYDPLGRGATRVLCESKVFAGACDNWMRSWQCTTEQRLDEAADVGLLRADVSPGPVARLVQAICTGHHTISEAVPGAPDLWHRMNDTWGTLLPSIAEPDWVAAWAAGPWSQRPAPTPEPYRAAAEPDGGTPGPGATMGPDGPAVARAG